MTADLISAEPDPAAAGSWILICFDFSAATGPVTLQVSWTGNDGYDEVPLSSEQPCQPYYVGPDCPGLLITDPTFQSADCAVAVTP